MMLKLLATVSLALAHFSAVPATTPNPSHDFAKMDAEIVGGCQATFTITRGLIDGYIAAMKETRQAIPQNQLAELAKTYNNQEGNFKDFDTLFKERIVARGMNAGVPAASTYMWRKTAYDEQQKRFAAMYNKSLSLPAEQRATLEYAKASMPAVIKCVDWYFGQQKIKII